MINCLHFKDTEIIDFLAKIDKIEDIEYSWHMIGDKKYPWSVHMKYSKMSTHEKIYEIINTIRNRS